MNESPVLTTQAVIRNHGRKKRWLKLVTLLSCVVVFCTTYALILPAITMEQETFCGMEEHAEHDESCYAAVKVCEYGEGTDAVGDSVLICCSEEEGHEHEDACYHVHSEACFERKLICDMPIHVHTEQCYSDAEKTESQVYWEKSMNSIKLTGIRGDDLTAIARSQLGYEESAENFMVQEDGATKLGYTRYGDWYGDMYGRWDAMFVCFCLNYAGMDEEQIPYAQDCGEWVELLDDADSYCAASEEYTPEKGNLVFFDFNEDAEADHVGIVTEVDEESGDLTVIEGGRNAQVEEQTYSCDNIALLGYGILPEDEEIVYSDATIKTITEDGITVTVSGLLPEGAEVQVEEVDEETVAELLEQLGAGTSVFAYDITIVDPRGKVWQPDTLGATVSITGLNIPEDELEVAHIPDEGEPEPVEVQRCSTESVAFTAESFSIYIGYTVEFHYDNLSYTIEGEDSVMLSTIFEQLGLREKLADVVDVTFSDETLLSVEAQDGDWCLCSLESFHTPEHLVVFFADGHSQDITVTDPEGTVLNAWNGNGLNVSNITTANSKYYLSMDCTANGSLTIKAANVTIDLNGHTLSLDAETGEGAKIIVNNGASLTIIDSNPTAEHRGKLSEWNTWYYPTTNGDVPLYGGVICTTNGGPCYGFLVHSGGTLNFNAGTLVGSFSNGKVEIKANEYRHAPIYVNGGTVNMNGGCVKYNYSGANAGAIYITGGGTVNMTTGSITECKGKLSGAVSVVDGSFNISGDAYVDDCECFAEPENMARAVGENAYITISDEAYIGNCNAYTGNGGDVYSDQDNHITIVTLPTFEYTMGGHKVLLSDIFSYLTANAEDFDYAIAEVTSVTSKAPEVTYTSSTGSIEASDFAGAKTMIVTVGTEKFLLKLSISVPSTNYVMSGRSVKLSSIFEAISCTKSISDIQDIVLAGAGLSKEALENDWKISSAGIFSGTKSVLLVFDDLTELRIDLTMSVDLVIGYEITGRNALLSDVLASASSTKSAADITAIEVGTTGFTATQIEGDWKLHYTESAADISDRWYDERYDWDDIAYKMFYGTKSLLVTFSDDSEIQVDLTSSSLAAYYDYFFGSTWTSAGIGDLLADRKTGYTTSDVAYVESAEPDYIKVSKGTDDWTVSVVQRYAGGDRVWLLVDLEDGNSLFISVQAPYANSVYFTSIPDVHYDYGDFSSCWSHGGGSYWFIRSMESYNGKISYCIQPGWAQNSWNRYNQEDESFWDDVSLYNDSGLSNETVKQLIGSVMYYGYHGNISTAWTVKASQYDEDMAKDMGAAIATQILIWESLCGQRDASFNHVHLAGYDDVLGTMYSSNDLYPYVISAYNDIVTKIKQSSMLPSFMKDSAAAATSTIMKLENSKYVTTWTDTNGVLDNYTYEAVGKNDVTITVDLNASTLTISTPTKYDEIVIKATSKATRNRYEVLVWHSGIYQDVCTLGDVITDPINGYAKAVNVMTGDLVVKKELAAGTTSNKSFPITLTIEDTKGTADFTSTDYMSAASFGGATIKSATKSKIVFTFNLKGGESKEFKSFIPVGAKVTVTETEHVNYSVYVTYGSTTVGDDTATMTDFSASGATMTVVNTPIEVGDVSVKKVVTGKTTTSAFPFTMTITDNSGKFDFTDEEYYGKAVIPTGVDRTAVSKSSVTFQFSLKNGESVTIKNLVPDGASVTVTETDPGIYTPTIQVGRVNSQNASYTYTVEGTGSTDFTVTNYAAETVNLTVCKKVTGVNDTVTVFNFELTVTDADGASIDLTGKTLPSGVTVKTNTKNVLQFSMKHNGSVSINGIIPKGSLVSLKEVSHPNFKVSMDRGTKGSDGDTWIFKLESSDTVTVTNTGLDVGDIMVSKKVVGDDAGEASFTVQMTITDTTGKFDFTDDAFYGRATIPDVVTRTAVTKSSVSFEFVLKDDEAVTMLDIVPDKATVVVKEVNPGKYSPSIEVYEVSTNGASRSFTVDGTGLTEVEIQNKVEEKVNLTVKKVVVGVADTTTQFQFELTVTDQSGEPLDLTELTLPTGVTVKDGTVNVLTFKLVNTGSISINGLLPKGVNISLKEVTHPNFSVKMDKGVVGEDGETYSFVLEETTEVVATNTSVPVGNIRVSKTVEGSTTTEAFSMKLTIKDTSGLVDFTDSVFMGRAKIPSGVTKVSATKDTIVFTFSIANKKAVVLQKIVPKGATITIEETDPGAFTPTISVNSDAGEAASSRTFTATSIDSAITVIVKNKAPEFVNLSVTKEVADDADNNTEFNFELTVNTAAGTAATLNASALPTGCTLKEGTTNVVQFSLANGDFVQINGVIPKGAKVKLVELSHPNFKVSMKNSALTENDKDTWEFVMSANEDVTVTNTPIDVGNVSVKKVVTGKPTTASFPFTLTIKDNSGLFDFTDTEFIGRATIPTGVTKVSATKDTIVFSFSLADGNTVEIDDLVPDGATVTVEETDPGEYTPTITIGTESSEGASKSVTISGTGTTAFVVSNYAKGYVSLKINKIVAGIVNNEKAFPFELVVTDAEDAPVDLSGKTLPSGVTLKAETVNVLTFALKNGESVSIEDILPIDGKVTLIETEHEGYTVVMEVNGARYDQDTKAVTMSDDTEITVTNTAGAVLPETGGIGTNLFTFGGLLMMAGACVFGFLFRRKRERGQER